MCVGVAGFIGSHLGDYLLNQGHEVVGIDNLVSGKKENVDNRINVLDIDIQDENAVIEAIRLEKPEYIFHLAAVSRTPWAIEQPLYTYRNNVVGTANVLQAALEAGVKKVIIASSNIVYAAQTPYKSSKLAMELVARDYNDLYGLPTVCLRFSNVYGAVNGQPLRQNEDNVLAALGKSKREKGYILIHGDGEQTRNFTHVSDICRALLLAANSDVQGTELDIMHPKAWTLNEIAKFYDCEVRYNEERRGDIKHLVMGIGQGKASELIGFEATINLEDEIGIYTK